MKAQRSQAIPASIVVLAIIVWQVLPQCPAFATPQAQIKESTPQHYRPCPDLIIEEKSIRLLKK
jgi:hypothetical protein